MGEIAAILRRLGIAQVLISGIPLCSGAASLRLMRSEAGHVPSETDRWLTPPTLGLLFGWSTAANAVSLTALAARSGLVDGESLPGAVLGSTLLISGTLVATFVILAGQGGPPQGQLAYSGAVLWAFAGIIADPVRCLDIHHHRGGIFGVASSDGLGRAGPWKLVSTMINDQS
jgi:hypothetical protein